MPHNYITTFGVNKGYDVGITKLSNVLLETIEIIKICFDCKNKMHFFDKFHKSINEIENYYIDTPKMFEIYENDLRTKRAVERNIEIIGEAMSRILKQDNRIEISNSRKIVDVRNRIIHGYDSVSDDVIWGIVVKNLPVLQKEVEKLLNE